MEKIKGSNMGVRKDQWAGKKGLHSLQRHQLKGRRSYKVNLDLLEINWELCSTGKILVGEGRKRETPTYN